MLLLFVALHLTKNSSLGKCNNDPIQLKAALIPNYTSAIWLVKTSTQVVMYVEERVKLDPFWIKNPELLNCSNKQDNPHILNCWLHVDPDWLPTVTELDGNAKEDKQKNPEYSCRGEKIKGQEIQTFTTKLHYFRYLQWNFFLRVTCPWFPVENLRKYIYNGDSQKCPVKKNKKNIRGDQRTDFNKSPHVILVSFLFIYLYDVEALHATRIRKYLVG